MPFPIEDKLVIAVSSTALFDLSYEHDLYKKLGVDEFRNFQKKNRTNIPKPGAAFPFVERLLSLNTIYPEELPFEVVILSRNHADAGLRILDAAVHYGLEISRSFFLAGEVPYPYIESIDAALYLSTNKDEVDEAVKLGYPAGYILPCETEIANDNQPLKIALDFDGIIANDEAEAIYKNTGSLEEFHNHEKERKDEPLPPGPLMQLLLKISKYQKIERQKAETMEQYTQMLQIAVVTARNAPSHERVITTLSEAGVDTDGLFLMGGIEKKRVLDVMKPHIFIDDQMDHLKPVAQTIPSVHVPYGIANKDIKEIPSVSRFRKLAEESFILNSSEKKLRNAQIANTVDKLKQLIWRNRSEIWSGCESLKPVQLLNPATILEQLGFKIVESSSLGVFEHQGKTYEVSAQIDRESNLIKVSSQEPKESRNFTLAHELGHALMHIQTGLHRDPPPDDMKDFRHEYKEREANKFAALFLMPEKLVREEFFEIYRVEKFVLNQDRYEVLKQSKHKNIDELVKTREGLASVLAKTGNYNRIHPVESLSERFNVSASAMAIRLIELDLV